MKTAERFRYSLNPDMNSNSDTPVSHNFQPSSQKLSVARKLDG